ncbi:hypothetical protein TNCV_2500221 [Trichonephila clavipes]|nr:hypothetical protein TNCV_2500221 [Trichonephila clavipes]
MPENGEDDNVEDIVQIPKLSHSEGVKAVETILRYFEQGASIMDLPCLRHLREEASKRRVQCRKQQGITHFLKKNRVFAQSAF